MSGRGGYLLSKVAWAIVTVFVVITFNFFLFRVLPGDPAKAGTKDPRLNPASIAALEERFGLDKEVFLDLDGGNPLDTQYFAYLGALGRGDLGLSYAFRDRQVIDLLGGALVNTLWLILPSQALSIGFGVILGLIAAWKRRTPIDVGALSFSLFMWSLPTFFLGIILLFLGANWFGLPTSGRVTVGARVRLLLGGGERHRRPPVPADPDAHAGPAGRVHAHHAQLGAGGLQRGLHPHRKGEGPLHVPHHSRPRAAQRDAASRHAHRHQPGIHRLRRHPGRVGVQLARASAASRCRPSTSATIPCCRVPSC